MAGVVNDHFDSLETRDPAAREKDLFTRLPAAIAHAMTAPGWAKHLGAIDPKSITVEDMLNNNKQTLPLLGN